MNRLTVNVNRKNLCLGLFSVVLVVMIMFSTMVPAYCQTQKSLQGLTPSGIPLAELEMHIDAYVDQYVGTTLPGAAVAVVKDGEIIFTKGYGLSDVEGGILVDSETTIFEWGSITKLFTWTAVMQLAEAGQLDLDADIRSYLSDAFLESWTFSQPITMRHLMNHTAGFGDYGFDLIYDTPEELGSLEEELLKTHPEQYIEVGTASAYSNYGTALAGYIIEEVSGMSYDAYLQEHFYTPLNMNSTTADRRFRVPVEMKSRKAKGYKPTGQSGYEETIWSYVGLGPAGSLNGTVGDLAQFAIALTPKAGQKTLLFEEAETIDVLLKPSYMLMANGFFEFEGAKQSFGHGGNTAGFTGQFAIVPEERFAVVTLTNVKGEINVGFGIQELLIGKNEYASAVASRELPSTQEVQGQYVSYRRFEGSFLEILSYLSPLTIEANGNNKVTLSMSGLKADYVQTEPYTYRIMNRDTPIFNTAFPILNFDMRNGTVQQLNVGHGFDLAPLPSAKGSLVQGVSLLVLIMSVLLALIGSLLLIKHGLTRREKGKGAGREKVRLIHGGAVVLLIALINNNVVCLGKFIVNSFMSFESIRIHMYTNYFIAACTLALVLYTFRHWSVEDFSRKYRLLTMSSVISLIGLLAVLMHWNFFVIY